jgi:hypothetical protein
MARRPPAGKGRAALAAALPVTVRFEPGDGDLPAAFPTQS